MLSKSGDRYGYLSMGIHWLMLLLLAAVYAAIELRELFPKGSDPREFLKSLHFMLGLCVFGLVWLRIAARLASGRPSINPPLSVMEERAAKLVHLALYGLMIALPLVGWMLLSAAAKPIPFFGLQLPPLTGEDKELAKTLKELHEVVGVAGYWLIGLHTVAALFHHYVRRNNTLLRMIPWRR